MTVNVISSVTKCTCNLHVSISFITLSARPLTCLSLRLPIGRHWTGRAYGFLFRLSGLIMNTNMCVAGVLWCFDSFLTKSVRLLRSKVKDLAIFDLTSLAAIFTLSITTSMSTINCLHIFSSSSFSVIFHAILSSSFSGALEDCFLS